jgi:hypothetical protein
MPSSMSTLKNNGHKMDNHSLSKDCKKNGIRSAGEILQLIKSKVSN